MLARHDDEEDLQEDYIYHANKDNCSRCKIAIPGRVPEIKWTSGAGDLVESLRRVWTILLNCWSNDDISLAVRTRLASPDIKTSVPYI